MENRRLETPKVSPQYEDAGLFQNAVCNVVVTLIPVINENNRGDMIIKGFLSSGQEIAVAFAGRRIKEAAPIIEQLNELRDQQSTYSDVRKSQLPMQIEGTWRPQFVEDDSGFANRTYHLLAAKWTVMSESGEPNAFGQSPAHWQTTAV